MKILTISDTHGFHKELKHFNGVDMVIHAGDFSNHGTPTMNLPEALDFLEWYNEIPVKYKILVAGNHDTALYAKLIHITDYPNIIYLEHESIEIEGIKIFGSPWVPQYGNWAFMKKRGKLDPLWQLIPENLDILITHGPPKGILDLAYNIDNILEYCGDKELLNHVLRVEPKYHIFGHIHNNTDNYNAGSRKLVGPHTKFMNVSAVTDRKFDLGLTSKGQIIEI